MPATKRATQIKLFSRTIAGSAAPNYLNRLARDHGGARLSRNEASPPKMANPLNQLHQHLYPNVCVTTGRAHQPTNFGQQVGLRFLRCEAAAPPLRSGPPFWQTLIPSSFAALDPRTCCRLSWKQGGAAIDFEPLCRQLLDFPRDPLALAHAEVENLVA